MQCQKEENIVLIIIIKFYVHGQWYQTGQAHPVKLIKTNGQSTSKRDYSTLCNRSGFSAMVERVLKIEAFRETKRI